MQIRIIEHLSLVNAEDWDQLGEDLSPFVSYTFLNTLEQTGCLHEYGWYPRHITVYDGERLIAAMPMYIKDNSYGELVFDWAWADAYHRAGLAYYPKLVTAIPYTPATGPRLLVHPEKEFSQLARVLCQAAIDHAREIKASTLHWLFTDDRDTAFLQQQGYAMRLGCQFHWENQGYEDFEHYLSFMTAAKRKKIRRERRRVAEQNVELEIRHGDEMNDTLWEIFHGFYCSTFDRKSGMPTLSLEFFKTIGEKMPRQIVLVFARHDGHYVASAVNFRNDHGLYGRHWGCSEAFHSLHFEACYYQGLDYCIAHGLQRFEPGAQGEHKITRGFLPTPTWSAHWVAHPEFAKVIDKYVLQEQEGMQHYIHSLQQHSPFRQTPANEA